MKEITQARLAKELGVSQSTISKALRNDPRLSDRVKMRIINACKTRGYRRSKEPDIDGRPFSPSHLISVLTYGRTLPEGYSHWVQSLFSAAVGSKRGLRLDTSSDLRRVVQSRATEAIIAFPYREEFERPLTLWTKKLMKPVVRIGKDVMLDDFGGGVSAARYLLECGRRSVIFCGYNKSDACSVQRYKGFISECERFGVNPKGRLLDPISDLGVKRALTGSLDGMVVANRRLAVQVYGILIRMGVKIPDDIAMMSICVGDPSSITGGAIKYILFDISTVAEQIVKRALARSKEMDSFFDTILVPPGIGGIIGDRGNGNDR